MINNKAISILLWMMMLVLFYTATTAQMLRLPDGGVNYKSKTARRVGVTDIEISWNAPGVKGREGKIWGTSVAPFGFTVLGYGSNVASPWRAGADESTTISFSTDVAINGKPLVKGRYGFFIALYADSCTLIFNKNTEGWGSYFYNEQLDVMRVTAYQQKGVKEMKERMNYTFVNQTPQSIEVALEWEYWRIPFKIEVDLINTTLASVKTQMSGAIGFDPASLEAAANWCLQNNVNYEEALNWINSAVSPALGGVQSFNALSVKAGLLIKLNRTEEADKVMETALNNAGVRDLHAYGRKLLAENKVKEAMAIFEKNHKKYNGMWPTNAGLMRGYSAIRDYKKALEYAKKAMEQAPDADSKRIIEEAIKTLTEGKAL